MVKLSNFRFNGLSLGDCKATGPLSPLSIYQMIP